MSINYKHYFAGFIACILFCSCKSLQRLSAHDNSVTNNHTTRIKKRNPDFIDGISVMPGNAVSQTEQSKSSNVRTHVKVVYAPPTDIMVSDFNIENANSLQFKYAVLLDASIEKLTNTLLLQNIDHWYGTHYCMGGSTEDCIDCSAFTQILMRDVYKADVPRTARAQYDNSERVLVENLQEGDFVFFQTGRGNDISHVGIYLTNNKFVHAATSNGVMVSDLNDVYWQSRYKGAGRVLKPGYALGK